MSTHSITILGGGNTAFSTAAYLTLKGFKITLFEISGFEESLAPIKDTGCIHLLGAAGQGTAKIHCLTTDIQEALAASDLILLIVPAYAHKAFAKVCLPYLTSRHTVVLMPGTLGSLEWHSILSLDESAQVTLAEVDTAPYVCRKTSPDTATIWGVVNKLGLGVLPSSKTAQVKAQLDPVFPGIQSFPDVMACGLAAMNPVVHPAGVLLNAGRVEYSKGEFYFYEEGVTPSVAKVIQQVDQERRDVAQGFGYKLLSVNEAFYHAGFGPKGDLWSTIHGSWMLTQLKAPGTLESRWLTEDIPYGLAAWSSLGEQYGTKTPTMRSLVDVGSIIMGFNGWEESRDVKRLGISEMDKTELSILLKTGKIVADCN